MSEQQDKLYNIIDLLKCN